MRKSTYQTACALRIHGYVDYIDMHANTEGSIERWSGFDLEAAASPHPLVCV